MKPILFNTEMVQAIISGQKTQTRRPIKNIKLEEKNDFISAIVDRKHNHISWAGHKNLFIRDFSPFQVGDILYVRETWCKGTIDCEELPDGREGALYVSQCIGDNDYIYKELCIRNDIYIDEVSWKPSIHMPKEATRIFLRIKNVSFEKVIDITTQDLNKEGFGNSEHSEGKKEFEKCWVKIYGEQSWENGFAWVYEFERISKEEAYV